MSRLDRSTVDTARAFLQPAVDAHILPKGQFSEMLTLLKKAASSGDEPASENAAQGLMTTAQAAEFLACSTKTVQRLGEQGLLDKIYLRSSSKSLRWSSEQIFQIANHNHQQTQEK